MICMTIKSVPERKRQNAETVCRAEWNRWDTVCRRNEGMPSCKSKGTVGKWGCCTRVQKISDVTAPSSKKSSFFVEIREVFPVAFFRWTHFPRPCHQTGPESFDWSIFMRFSLKETGDSRFCLPESYGAAY